MGATMSTLSERELYATIATYFDTGTQEISSESDLMSLGLDSLDFIEILMIVEDSTGVEFEFDEEIEIVKAGDLYRLYQDAERRLPACGER